MRILIDLQACQGESRFRGIGRYSLSLAIAMAELGKKRNHNILLMFNSLLPSTEIRKHFSKLVKSENMVELVVEGPLVAMKVGNEVRVKKAEYTREELLVALNVDFIHITEPFGGFLDDLVVSLPSKSIINNVGSTLYDLIPHAFPDQYLVDTNYRDFYYKKLEDLRRSNLFFAISESSRIEGIRILDIATESIINISAAVDKSFQKMTYTDNEKRNIFNKYKIQKSFIFYVPGGFDPRKNFERLLKAYSMLSLEIKEKHHLVIGSKASEETRNYILGKAIEFGLKEDDVILIGYINEGDLITLYNLCKLYIFPSLHEGFGLPILEAMACGAPVIGSKTTSIPEVIGRKDALFDPYSVESIFIKLKQCLTDEVFEKSLREHSLKRSKSFSWDFSAGKILDAIEKFINKKSE